MENNSKCGHKAKINPFRHFAGITDVTN